MNDLEIPGLTLVHEYVSPDQQARLTRIVDESPWRTDLKRRVQHWGWVYDYRARRVDPATYLGPLPPWAALLARRLAADHHMPEVPDMLIVNEYVPGQGISAHVDCVQCFSGTICSLSLGSQCVMSFSERGQGRIESLLLPPGSLLVLSGDARYRWTHAIPARKSDGKTQRTRRISLTFRTVTI